MEHILRKPLAISRPLSDILAISAAVLTTTLGAFVRVPLPFTPVPLTLQTMAVLVTAAALGRKAATAQALYLALGAAGLPVFSGAAGGLAHLMGPTGGYLAGFVVAAFAVGWIMAGKRKSFPATFGAMLLGSAIILALGAGWLAALLRLTPSKTLTMGVLPFVSGDLVKVSLAALAVWWMKNK